MWKFLLVCAALAACSAAAENTARAIDPNARCVYRASNMAYCLIKGQPYLCDGDECLPAQCTSILPVLESGNSTKTDP